MLEDTTLTNCFNESFLFTQEFSPQVEKVPYLNFFDVSSAERFLRNIHQDDSYWRRLAGDVATTPGGTSDDYPKHLAQSIVQGKLRIYKMPKGLANSHKQARQTFAQENSSDRIEITYAVAALSSQARPINAPSYEEAAALLDSLSLSEADIDKLSSTLTGKPSNDPALAREYLADGIAKGELVALNHGPRKTAKIPSALESVENLPGNRPAPLAGEIENWIEVKLLDEDGEPVADQDYVITDADGVEHKGKTDAKGTARLDKIASGDCEVNFVDLEGWS